MNLTDSSYAVVVTHEHSIDEETVKRILQLRTRPKYIGMIGSKRKRAMFIQRMISSGVPKELAESVRTPVGLNLGAKTPEEIAISIVAELVAVRRGKEPSAHW